MIRASFSPNFSKNSLAELPFFASAMASPLIFRGQDAVDSFVVRHVRHESKVIETKPFQGPAAGTHLLARRGHRRLADPLFGRPVVRLDPDERVALVAADQLRARVRRGAGLNRRLEPLLDVLL